MPWLLKYRIRHFFANSVWVLPVLCIFAALGATRVLFWIDSKSGWESPVNPETARAVLGTLAASMFTFIVFVSTALLVALQLASAQLTPRIIAIFFASPATRLSLSMFVFTFTLAIATLVRIGDDVPNLTMHVAVFCCVASLALFLYLIDHVGKALRPSGVLRSVGLMGRQVIKNVYPNKLIVDAKPVLPEKDVSGGREPLTIASRRDGVVLVFDVHGLAAIAKKLDCVVEVSPQVGDHIAVGDTLMRVYGRYPENSTGVLRKAVVVGLERTLEQDPTFPFRIMVDIASKGLSPAINDPTTAVLAIDQIHHLLRYVGTRDLDTGLVYDAAGQLRLIYRTPDWEDFVSLAVTEIRHFGAESIQVARRLRAMLESLIQNLPESRTTLLRKELALLHRSAERFFTEPEDRALAEISDAQGVGGKRSRQ
jgi:uncharacterized membrane protein